MTVADQANEQGHGGSAADMHGLLAAIVTSSNDAIVGKDFDGIVTSWNAAAERMFGFTAAEMIGQPITRIIPAERVAEAMSILARVRGGEWLSHFETERLTRDGRTIPVSLTLSPIRDAAGRVVGVSKTARDLGELQALNGELQRREALLQSVLRTVPDGLIVIDKAGVILSFSGAAERMFGYLANEVMGRNVSMLMPSGDAAGHDGYLHRYLTTGERRIIGIGRVVMARRKDGSEFPIELQVGEVDIVGTRLFTGFVRDLTERQERERRVAELQAELIHVSRLSELGQMVSVLAHEVLQPLTAIGNYVSGMRRMVGSDSPPALVRAMDKVAEQTERAQSIVQSLRGMVKKEQPPRRMENLATIIRETADLVRIGTHTAVHMQIDVAPEASEAFCDRVQIQQVLLNLMRNAIDAMAEVSLRRLTVTTRQVDGRVELRVSDTGPGLSDSVRARLFQPFVTSKADGLGVGLSICRTIVEGHGSALSVESEPGQGACFHFTLPSGGPPETPVL